MSAIADFIISKKPVIVILSGGEPLLIFDEIKEYIVRFYNSGIFVRIQTNGSLITPEIASFCKKYEVRLMVSFPCIDKDIFAQTTANEYTYDAVKAGMDYLKEYGVRFYPNIVVSKLNLHCVEKTAEYLTERYSFEKIFISRVTRPANASDLFEKYELSKNDLNSLFSLCEKLHKKYKIELTGCGGYPLCVFPSKASRKMFGKVCGAGKNGYFVDNEGNVKACSRDGNSLGNIFTDEFEPLIKKLKQWGDWNYIPEKCKDCKVVDACHGGCRMTLEDNIRRANSVDCDADPKNAPKSLPRHRERMINPFKKYTVERPIRVLEHEGVYRVSCYYRVLYLNREEAELLTSNEELSVMDISKKLGIPPRWAVRFMKSLRFSEIIR